MLNGKATALLSTKGTFHMPQCGPLSAVLDSSPGSAGGVLVPALVLTCQLLQDASHTARASCPMRLATVVRPYILSQVQDAK